MLSAYKYQIYPTDQQIQYLNQTLGLIRLYYNYNIQAKENDRFFKLLTYKQTFELFRPEAMEWMKEVNSNPLTNVYSILNQSYSNFFRQIKKNKTGKFINPPKFKTRKSTNSLTFQALPKFKPKFKDGGFYITKKLGLINGSYDRFCEGTIKRVTIRRTPTNKWFMSILVDKKQTKKNNNGKVIGIDWNCRDDSFLTYSDGTRTKCPRFLKSKEKKLSYQQKNLSRKYKKGAKVQSNNYYKNQHKVALIYEEVTNQRKDWLHRLSYSLCEQYQYIIVEDINLTTMASKLKHGKVVGDQGFGMLRQFIGYKGTLIKVNPAYTSKTCNDCGYINEQLKVGTNEWICQNCGVIHDRDHNAALNILNKGMLLIHNGLNNKYQQVGDTPNLNACGDLNKPMKQEDLKASGNIVTCKF